MTVRELKQNLSNFQDEQNVFCSVIINNEVGGVWRQFQDILEIGGSIENHTDVCILTGFNV